MTISNKRKQLVYDWLDTSLEERSPEKEFRLSIHLGYRALKNLQIDWLTDKKLENKREVELKGAYDAIEAERDNPANIAEDSKRWIAVEKTIYEQAIGGSYRDRELYAKLKKKLKEEISVTVGLSADEIARRNLEAERELREGGYRVEEVQEEPPLLSE